MKLTIWLIMLLSITSCSTSLQKEKPKSNVIVADGTEVKQFENLMFCGNMEAFVQASGAVSSKLTSAWEETVGSESKDECSIEIEVDREGNIINHKVVSCTNPEVLPAVLKKASPVPVSNNKCLFESINHIEFGLGNSKKAS
jgi:hypothetical protein